MAALTGLFIADSYKALLKTVDNDVLGAAAKEIVDGYGNVSGVLFDTSGNVTINGNFRALDAILDSSGSAGTAGQVLTTTGTTTQWQSLSSVSGVTGSGTAGYLPLWSTNSALTNSIALQSGSTITISGTLTATTKINTPTLQLTGGVGAQGTFSWNADEETVDLIQNGATLQLGQEIQIHCKNQTGALIPDGTPVYAAGTLGASGRIKIAPMIANGSIDAKYFLGVTTEDIADGDDGKVTTFGKIRGLNTAAYTEGQTLWVSSTTAGAFQTTRPLAPNLDLEVAIVINSHANNGTIFVRANNGHYLGTAHDVNISSVAENDLLVYKTNRWVNTKSIGDLSAANLTLTGYLQGPEIFVIDPAAHGNNEGLVQILGDLRVDGVTTTINSTTISVSDKNITLAKDAVTAGDANGAGITIAGANATLTYLSATDDFTFNKSINAVNGTFSGDVTGANLAISNWNDAYSWGDHAGLYSLLNHNHDDLYYTETESDAKYLLNTTDTLDGDLTVTGQLSVTGTIDLSNADLNIGAADIIFDTISTGANRGLIWNVSPSGFLSKLVGGGADGGKVTLFANMDDSITTGNIFEIKDGSTGSLFLGLSHAGILTAGGGTSTQWNTAYNYSQIGHLPLAGGTLTGGITVTAGEGREVATYLPSSYTTDDLVSGHEYGWYDDHWRLGMTRSSSTPGADFVVQWNGSRRLSLTNGGNLTVTGTLSASGYNKSNWDNAYTLLNSGSSGFYGLLYSSLDGDLNTYNLPGLYSAEYTGTTNRPLGSSGHFIQISDAGGNDVKTQFYYNYQGDRLFTRLQWGGGLWKSWRELIHDGNIGSQSVSYATTAGSATDSTKLPLTGGTITGNLDITGRIKFGGYSYIGEDLSDQDSLTIACDSSESIHFAQYNIATETYSTKMVLNPSGYLGINISNPADYLHISGPNDFSRGIRFSESDGDYLSKITFSSQGGANSNWGLNFYTPNAETTQVLNMALRGNGRVGINIADPSETLHVNGTAYINETLYVNGATTIDDNLFVNGYVRIPQNNALRAGSGLNWLIGQDETTNIIRIGSSAVANDFIFNSTSGNIVTIKSNGYTGIGNSDPQYRLDVGGNGRFTSYLDVNSYININGFVNTGNYFEKLLDTGFPHGQANLAVDIRFGNVGFWGYIEVEITGTYSNQNTPGKLSKVYAVGTNPGNNIYANESRVVDALGPIADNISLGSFEWDGAQSLYRIPISHIVSTGNNYTVKVKMFTHGGGAFGAFSNLSISPTYNRTAFARNYVHYNDRVGFGTVSPETNVHVSSTGHTKLRVGTTGVADASIEIHGYDAGLHIGDPTNGNRWAIWNDGLSTSSSLKIGSYALGTWYADSSQAVTITSSGLVGIGTVSPVIALSVRKDVNDWIGQFKNYGDSAYGLTVDLSGSTGGQLGYALGVYTQGGTGMFVRNDGRVGIGTINPSQKISVEGGSIKLNNDNAAGSYYLWLNKKEGQDGGILLQRDNALEWQIVNIGSSGDLFFYSYGSGSVAMTIKKSNGSVGIGTTSPDSLPYGGGGKFAVYQSGSSSFWINGNEMSLDGQGAYRDLSFYFRYSSSATLQTDSYFRFVQNATGQVMTIASNGYVGIGATSMSSKLTIYDSSNTTAGQQIRLGLSGSFDYTMGRNPNTGYLDFNGYNTAGSVYLGAHFQVPIKGGQRGNQNIVRDGLTLYLDFNDRACVGNEGSSTPGVTSLASINYQIDYYGGANFERKDGIGTMFFDNNADYLIVRNFFATTSNTYELWINSTAWGVGTVWDTIWDSGTERPLLGFYNGQPIFYPDGAVGSALSTNKWYQVVFAVNNDDDYDVYVNGYKIADGLNYSSNQRTGVFDAWIGGDGGLESFYGHIGIVRHYNRQLTEAEVLINYNADVQRFANVTPELGTYIKNGILYAGSNIEASNLNLKLNGNINKIGSGSTLKIINSNAITEMFVNGSGNLGIGIQNNTALAKVHVGGTFTGGYTSDASVGPMLVHNSSTDISTFGIKVKLDATTFGAAMAFWQGSTLRGYIGLSSGGTSYSTSSDYRLKENVVTLDNATEKVMQLKPKRFNFIDGDGVVVDGFLAHEVQEVIPVAVQGEKDGVDHQGNPIYQGIDHSKLVPLLTASLQEALKRIEILEEKINNLNK